MVEDCVPARHALPLGWEAGEPWKEPPPQTLGQMMLRMKVEEL